MIVSSKKFMTQLVESIGRMTAMCFEDGVKADKEVTRDLGKMRDALWEIRDVLWLIKGILADAAKEPEKPVKDDKPLADIFEDMNKTIKESALFEDVPKKERKTRRLRPSPEMRQVRSWAKHYHRSIREFSWAMRKMEMPIRESEGERRNLQYAWLTPEEAEKINRLLTEINR